MKLAAYCDKTCPYLKISDKPDFILLQSEGTKFFCGKTNTLLYHQDGQAIRTDACTMETMKEEIDELRAENETLKNRGSGI